MDIIVAPLTREHSDQLAVYLSTDSVLHEALSSGQSQEMVTGEEYYSTCLRWAEKRQGRCYAIILRDIPIGSISLCDIDQETQTASVGYWLATRHYGRGYATAAFAQIIEKARSLGVKILTCRIDPANAASIALWRRQGAELVESGGKVTPLLRLG